MMRHDTYALVFRSTWSLLILSGSLFLSGCLPLPIISDARKNIDKDTAASLQVGSTAKEDVLLQLGEPDYVSADERQFRYDWTGPGAVLVWLSPSSSNDVVGSYNYTLLLTFSADDVLARADVSRADGHVTENN